MKNDEKERILIELKNDGIVGFTDDDSIEREGARDLLEAKGYIREKNNNNYVLTEKGFDAIEESGYHALEEKLKKANRLDKQSTKSNIWQNTYGWGIALLITIAGILAAIFL